MAAVTAGALLLIVDLWALLLEILGAYPESFSEEALTTTYTVQSALWLTGVLLLLVAVVGLHARQSEAAGALGLVGFLAALIGTGLAVGVFWTNTFIPPALAAEAPAVLDTEPAGSLAFGFFFSFIVFGLGWVLFGVAVLRARVYPRVAAIVLIIGGLLALAPLPASALLIYAALIWLGVSALKEGHAASVGRVGAEAQPRVR